jgi:hypothetical protein
MGEDDKISVITEDGDLGGIVEELSEKDQKTFQEAKEKEEEKKY